MHLPSQRNHQELLASTGLIRFELAQGSDGPEATLLIKASTLELKYLLRLKKIRLYLFKISDERIGYGVQIDDDPEHPGTAWSIFEYEDEHAGALALKERFKCMLFLFNELAINVAWGETYLDLSGYAPAYFLDSAKLGAIPDASVYQDEVHATLDALLQGKAGPSVGVLLDWATVPEWHPIYGHYVTNQLQQGFISVFEDNEGAQQEEIAHWLIDNLDPAGAFRNPQVHEEGGVRELCDLLLSHQYGAFLIESKTLSIWVRPELPRRTKLASQIRKHHLPEAIRQITGTVKNLRRGLPITDQEGREIQVEREALPHIIVLIPDLTLLHDATEFGGEFFKQKSLDTKSFFHILDPGQLLRIVQAAGVLAARAESITQLMFFDYLLMERAERSLTQDTPNFDVIHRFVKEED